MKSPGMSPATRRVPIETLAMEPAMTIRIDGGMIDDRVEVQSVMPTA